MFFPYLELAASLFILLLAFRVWTRHYEDRLARFYAIFAFTAFLAAILTYSLRIAFTLEIARDINRISATLWAFVFALYAHFVLLFTKKEDFLENPISYLMLYLPPSVLGFLFLFTGQMYTRYEIWNIGIVSVPSPLYSLFTLEAFGFCLWGIVLLFNYARTTPQKAERLQSLLMLFGSVIPVGVGIVNDMLLPAIAGARFTPPTVVFDMALMNLFIFIAMRRYALFSISPAIAADTIIETMPDSLIVTDLIGRILFINEEAQKLFKVSKEDVIKHQLVNFFRQKDDFFRLYQEVAKKGLVVERFEAEMVDPLGERIPALINARLLKEKIVGETLGIVFVIRDIRG